MDEIKFLWYHHDALVYCFDLMLLQVKGGKYATTNNL